MQSLVESYKQIIARKEQQRDARKALLAGLTILAVIAVVIFFILQQQEKTGIATQRPPTAQQGNSNEPKPAETQKYYQSTVVANGGLNLREGPGTNYGIIMTIPNGEKVQTEIGREAQGWKYIKYGNKEGWVSSDYLR